MRRTGKTTLIQKLLEESSCQNKLYLDLERVEHRYLFQQPNYREIEVGLAIEGLDLQQPALLALDEIQLVPQIASVLKYFYDTYGLKLLLSGSSSFYFRNRFSESMAGRKRIFELTPLNFREYLKMINRQSTWQPAEPFQAVQPAALAKWGADFRQYLIWGGFPEVVLAQTDQDRKAYLSDILNAYIELDIKLLSDFEISDNLYRLIRLLGPRTGSRLDHSKLSSLSGIPRPKIKDYLTLLEHTYLIRLLPPFTQSPDREIASQKKLYFSDNGLLQVLNIHEKGALLENMVCNTLATMGDLRYWARRSGQEIDFILDHQWAFEVKYSPTAADLQNLNRRAKSLNLKNSRLIGAEMPAENFKDFVWAGTLGWNNP